MNSANIQGLIIDRFMPDRIVNERRYGQYAYYLVNMWLSAVSVERSPLLDHVSRVFKVVDEKFLSCGICSFKHGYGVSLNKDSVNWFFG